MIIYIYIIYTAKKIVNILDVLYNYFVGINIFNCKSKLSMHIYYKSA